MSNARRNWAGPEPNPQQLLLLQACWGPDERAVKSWHQWLNHSSFDEEDPASHELASMAVARLGAKAGSGSEVKRCRGWNRRAWYVSAIAEKTAGILEATAIDLGLQVIPMGDLATFRAGLKYMGRPLPIRKLEFHIPKAKADDLIQLQKAVTQGCIGEILTTPRLPLKIWSCGKIVDCHTAAGRIAWLIERNWRRHPPDQLRWMIEILQTIETSKHIDLATQIAEAAKRNSSIAFVNAAFNWLTTSSLANHELKEIARWLSNENTSLAASISFWRTKHSPAGRIKRIISNFVPNQKGN